MWKSLWRNKKEVYFRTPFSKNDDGDYNNTMDTLSYKTISGNKETANKQWLLVDVEGKNLGRVCSEIAYLLRGKHKTNFTPHADCGDNVVVINASKVALTGGKWDEKEYIRYTGYPGGQRFATPREVMAKNPIGMIEMAVRGMLPKNRLGRAVFKNLYVYPDTAHDQIAQQPKVHNITR